MKILLDAHILIWFFSGDEQLSRKACDYLKLKGAANAAPFYFAGIL